MLIWYRIDMYHKNHICDVSTECATQPALMKIYVCDVIDKLLGNLSLFTFPQIRNLLLPAIAQPN